MSAIVVLKQKDAIHFVTDGLSYTSDGVVTGCDTKVGIVEDLNMAIFTRGPSFAARTAAEFFADRFETFDNFVMSATEAIKSFYEAYEPEMRSSGHPDLELYFSGWSESKNKPEGYRVRCGYSDSVMFSGMENRADGRIVDEPFSLLTLPNVCVAPGLLPQQLSAARFPSHLKPNQMTPEVDALHLIEILRRTPTARFSGQPKSITVGGHAELTSVSATGVRQRILATYDFTIGEPLAPAAPVNWKAWRRSAECGLVRGHKLVHAA